MAVPDRRECVPISVASKPRVILPPMKVQGFKTVDYGAGQRTYWDLVCATGVEQMNHWEFARCRILDIAARNHYLLGFAICHTRMHLEVDQMNR
jgi:hypothetical protein